MAYFQFAARMSIYQGIFDKAISGLRLIDRSAEGFLEIVYDQCFDPSQPRPYDAGPYILTIEKDGVPFGQPISRPNHFYGSCWWIDLAPVTTIVRDPAYLIANGLIPPLGQTGIPLKLPVPGSVKFPGPMQLSSDVTGYEPTTGERPEIGIVTANSVLFLITGDARNMLEDAKDVATQPIWNYDNGKPIDLIAKPKTTNYSTNAQGGPPNWLGPHPPAPVDPLAVRQPSTPQTAHMAELCGVVAMATGAPRYIRALQMRVVRGFAGDNIGTGLYGAASVFHNEMRGVAWLLRQLFYCYHATLLAEQAGNLPADCHGSAHWKHIIDNQASQFTKYIEPTPLFQALGIIGQNLGMVAWWQCDMVNQVLGLYAGKWPNVWGPIYIKVLKNLMARVNGDGKGQWPIALPSWYWGNVFSDSTKSASGAMTPGKIPYQDYSQIWAAWSVGQAAGTDISGNNNFVTAAQVAALNRDPTNGLTYTRPNGYESWALGALSFAVYLDRGVLAGAVSAAFPNLEQAYSQQMAMMGKLKSLFPQCSISVTPQSIHIPPVPTPKPAKDIKMSTPFSLAADQASIQLNLTVNPPDADLSTLAYRASPADAVTLAPNAAGVLVQRITGKKGAVSVFADVQGAGGIVETESDGTVAGPLAVSLSLDPAS